MKSRLNTPPIESYIRKQSPLKLDCRNGATPHQIRCHDNLIAVATQLSKFEAAKNPNIADLKDLAQDAAYYKFILGSGSLQSNKPLVDRHRRFTQVIDPSLNRVIADSTYKAYAICIPEVLRPLVELWFLVLLYSTLLFMLLYTSHKYDLDPDYWSTTYLKHWIATAAFIAVVSAYEIYILVRGRIVKVLSFLHYKTRTRVYNMLLWYFEFYEPYDVHFGMPATYVDLKLIYKFINEADQLSLTIGSGVDVTIDVGDIVSGTCNFRIKDVDGDGFHFEEHSVIEHLVSYLRNYSPTRSVGVANALSRCIKYLSENSDCPMSHQYGSAVIAFDEYSRGTPYDIESSTDK